MNQLIHEDDETCPLQNCRTILDFPAHEHLSLNHGCHQAGDRSDWLLQTTAERKRSTNHIVACFWDSFLSSWCRKWVEFSLCDGYRWKNWKVIFWIFLSKQFNFWQFLIETAFRRPPVKRLQQHGTMGPMVLSNYQCINWFSVATNNSSASFLQAHGEIKARGKKAQDHRRSWLCL